MALKHSYWSTGVKISDSTTAHLLATNTNHHYVKCIDIYPQQEPDILLAVGQANGKVVLTTFGPTAFDSLGLTGKELGINSILSYFYFYFNHLGHQ